MQITTKLWKHQIPMHDNTVAALQEFGYSWLLAGCATGKTLTSLTVGSTLAAEKILILTTKAAAKSTWPDEIEKHIPGQNYLNLVNGTSKQKAVDMRRYLQTWPDEVRIVIVNYETAALIADDIKAANFDYVIADECQKLKSHDSKQSVLLARACAAIPYRLAMTGTGWSDRPTDVYGQVRWLNPEVKGAKTCHSRLLSTWGSFFFSYVDFHEMANGVKIVNKYKNLDKLAAVIKPFTYHVESEKVLTLPPKLTITRNVEFSGELKRLYKELETELLAKFGSDYLVGDNKLVCELRLHQLTGGYVVPYRVDELGRYVPAAAIATAVPDKSADAKLEALLDIMDEIGDNPVVIFTQFKADVAKIAAALAKQGKVIKLLTGETKEHDDFQRGKGDVLIANIQAGNAGITLTRARYAIYYTVGSSRTMFDQSEWRIRRPGSDLNYPITEFFLRMGGTIDDTLWERMLTKANNEEMLMSGIREQEL